MSINPFSQSVFSMTATCLPCCVGGASECGCQLFIPQVTSPPSDPPIYADAAAAASAITNFVAGCYVYGGSPPPGFFTIPVTPLEDFTADWDAATNTLTFESGPYSAGSQPDIGFSGSISVSAGAVVTFDLSRSPARSDGGDGMAYILVYTCDSTSTSPTIVFEENISNIGTGGNYNWTVTDAGTYFFVLAYTNNGTTTFSTSTSVSCDVDMAANPVIARYDSGDPANPWLLEACPKLLIPAGTEWTGDWYASDTDAQTALDTQVVDCLAYTIGTLDNITASVTGSEFSAGLTDGDGNSGIEISDTWMAVSLVEGETVSISVSTSTTTVCIDGSGPVVAEDAFVAAYLYDDKGNIILSASNSTVSAPSISASDSMTAPYTGKYYFVFQGNSRQGLGGDCDEESATSSFEAEITSTGLTGPHPVQALYDAGLLCSGKLDCE